MIESFDPNRWLGIKRPYSEDDVYRLRGHYKLRHPLAEIVSEILWSLLKENPYISALGAQTGMQAVQMIRAGLRTIYVSGWQTAADANLDRETYPDQSLYGTPSVPLLVDRINRALLRQDQIESVEGKRTRNWLVPLVADAEAGFGGKLNAFELMKKMIEAGAAGVHFEDQLGSAKKCGHLGGKVLVPTRQFIETLIAARLAADVMGVPTVLIARTDAEAATLLTSDIDDRDKPFVDGERTSEGFFRVKPGLDSAIARLLSYAPYADLLWVETKTPNLEDAQRVADAVHAQYPCKMLAYNCSPSFNWRSHLDAETIGKFQTELGKMDYKFQFVTLAGFHALNASMFKLARAYGERGMSGYVNLQDEEFDMQGDGYTAVQHQREVGTGYFDEVDRIISAGQSSLSAMKDSTEAKQFSR